MISAGSLVRVQSRPPFFAKRKMPSVASAKEGPLPLEQVPHYALDIADALDKANRKGVTHRDLKPGNIIQTKAGSKLVAAL